MLKKIDIGKTHLANLHEVFKVNENDFENKKARLFPSGNTDNEIHTTSIFLASLCAVKEYREEILLNIGVKKIKTRNVQLHAFTEINSLSKEDRPDALLVITSGKISPIIEWVAFIEFKVGKEKIDQIQIDRYICFANEIGIKNIITISNQLVTNPFESPVSSKRKTSFSLYHWSWAYLKVTTSRLIRNHSIEDEDHIYILGEFRRYLDHHKKIEHFNNMGKQWKESVNKIHSYQINQIVEPSLLESIITAYQQEEKDISLQLTNSTNCHVELIPHRGDRKTKLESMLNKYKIITSTFYIDQNKEKSFSVEIDFIRQEIRCLTEISISQGKAQAQTSRLINFFEDQSGYTDEILINAIYLRNRGLKNDVTLASLFKQKEEDSSYYSILNKKYGDEVKFFEVKTKDLLGRNFQSSKNFIIKLEAITNRFIKQVMQMM